MLFLNYIPQTENQIILKKENTLKPEVFVGKRILSTFVLFNVYTTIFVLLHNTLFKANLLYGSKLYGKKEILNRILNGITFNYSETMLGAFWFLPMFLVTLVLFAYFISLSTKTKYPNILNILILLFIPVIIEPVNKVWHLGSYAFFPLRTSFTMFTKNMTPTAWWWI